MTIIRMPHIDATAYECGREDVVTFSSKLRFINLRDGVQVSEKDARNTFLARLNQVFFAYPALLDRFIGSVSAFPVRLLEVSADLLAFKLESPAFHHFWHTDPVELSPRSPFYPVRASNQTQQTPFISMVDQTARNVFVPDFRLKPISACKYIEFCAVMVHFEYTSTVVITEELASIVWKGVVWNAYRFAALTAKNDANNQVDIK